MHVYLQGNPSTKDGGHGRLGTGQSLQRRVASAGRDRHLLQAPTRPQWPEGGQGQEVRLVLRVHPRLKREGGDGRAAGLGAQRMPFAAQRLGMPAKGTGPGALTPWCRCPATSLLRGSGARTPSQLLDSAQAVWSQGPRISPELMSSC